MTKRHFIIASILGGILLFMVSCASTRVFTETGMPHAKFQVGGGWEINYKAPSNGTLYWVETKGGKILQTQSVQKGKEVEFGAMPDPTDPDIIKAVEELMGVPLGEVDLRLYFVPEDLDKSEDSDKS